MKKTVFTVLFALQTVLAAAQESQTVYNFLRLPVSAHAAALGGDNITIIEDDPTLMFCNPALISSVSDKSVNLNFMTYMEGATTASASFTKALGDKATWAVSAQYMDYGEMKEMTAENIQTGTFRAKDMSIAGYFAYALAPKLVGGITAKFINSNIASYHSMAAGVDLGVNYYDEERGLSASFVTKNLGGQIKAYEDDYEAIPLDMQIGVSKRLEGAPFRLSVMMDDLTHWDYKFMNHFVFGVDILLGETIYIAGGYNCRRAYDMKIADDEDGESAHGAGLSLGAGIQLERFKLQIGYGKYHVSAGSLIGNITYTF